MTTLAQTGKRSTILAAVALTIGMVSWLVYFVPSFAKELTQVSTLAVENNLVHQAIMQHRGQAAVIRVSDTVAWRTVSTIGA